MHTILPVYTCSLALCVIVMSHEFCPQSMLTRIRHTHTHSHLIDCFHHREKYIEAIRERRIAEYKARISKQVRFLCTVIKMWQSYKPIFVCTDNWDL